MTVSPLHALEIDWRIDPLRDVMTGIRSGLVSVMRRMEETDGFDAGFALDHAETLLGVAFVATQAYIVGTCTDYNEARGQAGLPPMEPHKCHVQDPVSVAGGVSRIQLLVAIANYFKHHDEWPAKKWPSAGRGRHSVEILGRVGITEATEHPCVQAANLLCGEAWRLNDLSATASSWRADLLRDVRKRVGK